MNRTNEQDKHVALAILSVALLTVMAGAVVAPAIATIAESFPAVRPETIKLVITLPSLMVIPFALCANRLTYVFGKRQVLLAGLFLYLIGGVGGGFADSIELLLCCRALLGISVGLIMPISTSLVSDYFDGIRATKMMGWISASNQLGGVVAQIISGTLATLCWRYSFGAYGLVCVAIVMVLFYLKEPATIKTQTPSINSRLPVSVYCYAGASFLLMLVFYTVPVNISLLIMEAELGNATSAGIACALTTGAGFVMGLCFQKLNNSLSHFSVFISTSLMACGFGILSVSHSLLQIFLGALLIGLGNGYLLPYMFHRVRIVSKHHQSVSAMAILTSMLYLGQFSSPLIIDKMGKLWTSPSSQSPYIISFWLSIGITTLILISLLITPRKKLRIQGVTPKEISQ